MIPKGIKTEFLIERIRVDGACYLEHRQVYSRIQKLLSDKRRLIAEGLKREGAPTKLAARDAFCSSEYSEFVHHLLKMRKQSLQSKIDYECGILLHQARQACRHLGSS